MPKARTELPIEPKPRTEVPHLFGRGMRDRLLMTLAVNDRPLYLSELTRALGSDMTKVRKTLKILTEMGIVSDTHSGNLNVRYIALNPAFPGYPALLRLLRVLDRKWPQPRLPKPARTAERLALRGVKVTGPARLRNIDNLFYSPPRTRTLLTIAAMGDTDVTDIVGTLGLGNVSVWNVVNQLQREGVIRSIVKGRRRALELDPTFPAARELRLFLKQLVAVTEEYAGLARLSMRRPNSPRFSCQR